MDNNSANLIIFGASGFIGQHFIKEISLDRCLAVSRSDRNNPKWIKADLAECHSIESILKPGMTVINLAYSQLASSDKNIKMAQNLVQAAVKANVSRLVHCSTAVVVGNNPSSFVNEETVCNPETAYEKTKYAIERIFLDAANSNLTICILRPTAVIGPHGQNLKKMVSEICNEMAIIHFIRSSIYGTRQLNLVAVKDVVKALLHLAHEISITSGIYICSADDDPDNRYNHIETLIRTVLQKKLRWRSVNLPSFFLKTLLRFSRSGCGRVANRHFSSEKLFSTGFHRSMSISNAVKDFILSEAF